MKKEFIGDFEFNNIEVDIEKNIYRIDGKDVGDKTLEFSILIGPKTVRTQIINLDSKCSKRKDINHDRS